MANSESTSDLLKGALQRAGEFTNGRSDYEELALKYINRVYKDLLAGSNEFDPEIGDAWVWARKSAVLIVKGYYSTGTITLTQGSANGTFSSAPAASQVGRYLLLDGNQDYWYRIATHTAATTSFTLDSVYLGTSASGKGFKLLLLEYDLVQSLPATSKGILRLAEPFRFSGQNRWLTLYENYQDRGSIYGLDIDNFRRKYPLQLYENRVPTKFATVSRSDSTWNIIFNHYVTSDTRLDFDYIEIQSDLINTDDSIPLIPLEFRDILETGAAFYLLTDKNDKDKATTNFQLTKAKLKAMQLAEQKNNQVTANGYGKLAARQGDVPTRLRYWWF